MYPHPDIAYRLTAQELDDAREAAERARFARANADQIRPRRGWRSWFHRSAARTARTAAGTTAAALAPRSVPGIARSTADCPTCA
jgi:hypothetical protein